jgi:hypothetical protein
MSNALDGHAMAWHWELQERTSARKKKKKQWLRQSGELVNNKSKRISS